MPDALLKDTGTPSAAAVTDQELEETTKREAARLPTREVADLLRELVRTVHSARRRSRRRPVGSPGPPARTRALVVVLFADRLGRFVRVNGQSRAGRGVKVR
ncbi:hypothetical protein ACIQCG_10385 [Streptomyces noursei]|uniref:hypothetical protein n=1 Tax=Streptomyces noursei TaxID=1971 RepID=UPI0038009230